MTWPLGRAVRVRVPATSANLGPGFDCLALAVQLYDELTVEVTRAGLDIDVVGEGAAEVARDESHLVVRALRIAADRLGGQPPGLRLRCSNTIPHGRGLGSSAAAIVAGLLAGRALHPGGRDLSDAELLAIAAEVEGHPDNAAACLLGGVTIAWTEDGAARAVRLEPHPRLAVTLLVPRSALSTHTARGLLPHHVPHAEAARNAGRAALLVHALTAEPALLLAGTQDWLHQSYRAPAMPETAELIARLRARGIAAVVSGAGPSVAAFTELSLAADLPPGWTLHRLSVDIAGAAEIGLFNTSSAPETLRGPS
ncbi:MAG: homoserine kinase [Geodermatophilaceae bacterium]|nr:homoserine kinase [Geodermatophilaceae bacterium]